MGALLDRLRGRTRLQPDRIKAVWNVYITDHEEYFHKVIRNVTRRDEGMRGIIMSSKHAESDDERDFVLRLLATRIAGFFHTIVQDETLTNMSELKKSCYNMGQQHAAFSQDSFKIVYWEEFTLAFVEELEETGTVPREDLRAWQTFLHVIEENMQIGYQNARSQMRN